MLTVDEVMAYAGPRAPQLPDTQRPQWTAAMEHHLIATAQPSRLHSVQYKAALYLVLAFQQGALMRTTAFRTAVLPVPDAPTLHLHVMGDALLEEELPPGRHSLAAFDLACALGMDAAMPRLSSMLRGLDLWNRWVVATTMAIATEQVPLILPSGARTVREERLKREWQAQAAVEKGTATTEDHCIRAEAMQRHLTGALL